MDTIQGNKLIENFIGKEVHDKLLYNEFGGIDTSACTGFYHTSWDWLHPVISKICDLALKEKLVRSKEFRPIYELKIYSEIEEVYNKVTDFIHWYNSNQNS